MLRVNNKSLPRSRTILLPPLGDDTDTADADNEECRFRRFKRDGEVLLLLLLPGEETDGDAGKRMSLGITALLADDCIPLVFTAVDFGRPTTPMRHFGGNTSLANIHNIIKHYQ